MGAAELGRSGCGGIHNAGVLRILAVILVNAVANALSRRDLVQTAVLRIYEEEPARLEPEELREALFKALAEGRVLLLSHEFADYIHNIHG